MQDDPSQQPGAPDWIPLTADEPPTRFRIRAAPEDFEVEELPLFESAGEGTHLYLWIEKRGLTTREALRRLARALGAPLRDFGAAGRKDRHALTRQWVSVEHVAPEAARGLALEGLRVLRAERHPKKLRPGALRGNRFRLRLRDVAARDRPRLERALERVAARGLPNYYGAQRFGATGRNDALGLLLLQRRPRELALALAAPPFAPDDEAHAALRAALAADDRAALRRLARAPGALGRDLAALARQLDRRPGDWRSALRALDRELLALLVGAVQARVFNRVLARRVAACDAPAFDELAPGDLAFLHDRGAVFAVEDPGELAPRLAAFELSPSGPVFGHRTTLASGRPGELEQAALAGLGLAPEAFAGLGPGLDQRGARRPLRVRAAGLELAWQGADALLAFELEKGAYATALLAELGGPGYLAGPEDPPLQMASARGR